MNAEGSAEKACPHAVIVADCNTGTDHEPTMTVIASCDGARATDCGWEVEHLDHWGNPHTVGDWWLTSDQMTAYVEAHQQHAANTTPPEAPK